MSADHLMFLGFFSSTLQEAGRFLSVRLTLLRDGEPPRMARPDGAAAPSSATQHEPPPSTNKTGLPGLSASQRQQPPNRTVAVTNTMEASRQYMHFSPYPFTA